MNKSIKTIKKEIKLFRKFSRTRQSNRLATPTIQRELRNKVLILDSLMSNNRVLH